MNSEKQRNENYMNIRIVINQDLTELLLFLRAQVSAVHIFRKLLFEKGLSHYIMAVKEAIQNYHFQLGGITESSFIFMRSQGCKF